MAYQHSTGLQGSEGGERSVGSEGGDRVRGMCGRGVKGLPVRDEV